MRKKSITLLICVYAALCISYTVVSSAMMPESDDSFLYVEQESSKTTIQSSMSDKSSDSEKNKASAVTESKSPISENEVSKAVDSNTVSEKNNPESEVTEVPDIIKYESETENDTDDTSLYSEESSDDDYSSDKPEMSYLPEPDTSEVIISQDESEEESQEQINNEDEYQEEKPTLAEFLSGLRCSGCRHNCSLLSPRCMNGSRKVSQAESAYYATYGA